jgi:hypothetical protein
MMYCFTVMIAAPEVCLLETWRIILQQLADCRNMEHHWDRQVVLLYWGSSSY